MTRHILYEEKDYGMITLNRPEKRNAISAAMAKDLSTLLDQLKENPPKFIVIQSNGDKVFCAGGDLNELNDQLDVQEAYEHLHPMKEVLYKLATFPTPTICLLQGNAFGGGCELATACDLRIAKENTQFGFIQSNLGILPGWGGGALLYKKTTSSFAFQWIMEGRIYTAEQLNQRGWIHRLIQEKQWGDYTYILKDYLTKSKQQCLFMKEQYLQAIDELSLYKLMDDESKRCAQLWPSDEHKRAVQQFLNK